MPEVDFLVALGSVMVIGAVALLYAGRTLRAGRFVSDRADELGGSAVLGRWAMDMGYWALGPVVRLCLAARIPANALTWLSLALGGLAGGLMAAGRLGQAAVAGMVGSLCDALDGQVARGAGQASDAGEVLDAAVDRFVDFFLLGGLAFHYRGSPAALALVLLALCAAFMTSYATAKAEALQLAMPRGTMRRHERLVYILGGAALSALFGDYPLLAALLIVGAVGNASAVRRLAWLARAAATRTGPP